MRHAIAPGQLSVSTLLTRALADHIAAGRSAVTFAPLRWPGRHRLDAPRPMDQPVIHLHPFFGWVTEDGDGREAWGPHASEDGAW